ncbi:MAG: DNA-deoxyinosine glycosylase [Bacteroidales bacterium]|nr:DNA-deoxyinosine glycosylase [Bacteroidales bacterium]
MELFSFPSIVKPDAKILILGTMPGKTSLEINEYYGYKHNVFWKIMFELFEIEYSNNYKIKKSLLKNNNIALWDTLKYCERKGSLDSNIKNEEINDFNVFFSEARNIKAVLFNGKSAYNFYKKHIGFNDDFRYYSLPSTSPANASMNFETKLKHWSIIKTLLNE